MKKDFPAFLSGELEPNQDKQFREHLEVCPVCERELEEMTKIIEGAESIQDNIAQDMESIDWNVLPRQIADRILKQESWLPRESRLSRFWKSLFLPQWKPVYAGAAAGIVLGFLAAILILKPDFLTRTRTEKIYASQDFIEKVELQMARRETLDYLEKSRYLILDFIQSPSDKVRSGQNAFASQRARDLLSKKKYINQELDKFQLAKAKEICDQIELLFLELSQVSQELTAEEIAKIQDFVKQKQLLLKIKLVKKELEENEV